MEVLEGRMIFYVDGKEIVGSAGDPPIVIAAGVVHGFSASTFPPILCWTKIQVGFELSSPITYLKLTRATVKGEQVTFKESTRPSGTFKAHFFQDLFQSSASPGFLLAMRVFYDGDTYVSLPGKFWVLDYVVRYPGESSTTVDSLLTNKFISVVGLISKAFAPTKLPDIKRMGEQGATAE
jgi:hypothetical protein